MQLGINSLRLILLIFLFIFIDKTSESKIVDTIEALEEKSIGKKDAPIKMVEFASMTCGACAKFHNEVFPEIKKNCIKWKTTLNSDLLKKRPMVKIGH